MTTPLPAALVAAPLFRLRAGISDDHAYVISSWTGSNGFTSQARMMGSGYVAAQRTMIQQLLKDGARLDVACTPDADAAILGWACTEPERWLLHYVYVRRDAWRNGIAGALLAEAGFEREHRVTYTHRPVARGVRPPEHWSYNPLATRSP